jgi:DNA-binding beta-propeller fold protein YncE
MRFGAGDFQYELVVGWGRLPRGWEFGQVASVAVDSQDRVYAYHRGMRPVIVFSREGAVLTAWGDGQLAEAHGMYIDPEDHVFLVDRGAHTIEKRTFGGDVLLTLGEKYQSAPKYSNLPFNRPQGVAIAPNGHIYVADGRRYNFCVHEFSAGGEHLKTWGKRGNGPGEFAEPHSIWVMPDGTIMVGDRGNDRIQYFSPDGHFIRQWTALEHPDHFFVAPDGTVFLTEIRTHSLNIYSPDGQKLSGWGGRPSQEPGQFFAPHGVWVDRHGDLYVSEVMQGRRVQKFTRVG